MSAERTNWRRSERLLRYATPTQVGAATFSQIPTCTRACQLQFKLNACQHDSRLLFYLSVSPSAVLPLSLPLPLPPPPPPLPPDDFADPEDRDHVDAARPPLSQHLACISDVVLDVQGLASGYSKDVHGQLTIRTMATILAPCATSQDLQFKTRDNGVSFFAPGTSAAVL